MKYCLQVFVASLLIFACCARPGKAQNISGCYLEAYLLPPTNITRQASRVEKLSLGFDEHSVSVPSKHASYRALNKCDSLYELFYKVVAIDEEWISKCIAGSRKIDFPPTNTMAHRGYLTNMYLIVHGKQSVDTVFIYNNLVMGVGSNDYLISEEFWNFLLNLMPAELRYAWENPFDERLIKGAGSRSERVRRK